MLERIEKRFFGSSITVLLIFMYFEIRDLRIQVKNLESRVNHHIIFKSKQSAEVKIKDLEKLKK